MINSIENIKSKSPRYVKEFISGCTIEEKIDTHYISVEIISRNDIKIKKANGNEIDRVDLILNSMWNNLFLDWNYLKLSNKDWFATHVGYIIKMFYFPCNKPLLTEYDSNTRYIFDRMTFNGQEINIKQEISKLKFPDAYKIDYKRALDKINVNEALNKFKNADNSIEDFVNTIVDKTKCFAIGEPEGYIFKYNNKIYQFVKNENRKIEQEKSSYEFLLADFIKYCKLHNYSDKICQSYTKTVCNLFNDYIVNSEKKTHTIENNIEVSGIENPYLGAKFDLGYEHIPDQVTKTLCQESELYKNIFKVLLANLRKGKDATHCILLSKKEVDYWNNVMKSLKIRNVYI